MLPINFPIAGVTEDAVLLMGLAFLVSVISAMFGVGGGFIMTPILIFLGIPPAVAVSTEPARVTTSSFAGATANWARGLVDFRMGVILLLSGAAGSALGVTIFRMLREDGRLDVFIAVAYVLLLTIIGGLMLRESLRALREGGREAHQEDAAPPGWVTALPFRMTFPTSGIRVSVLPPIALGVFVGLVAALMGVGGGFIIVPALIYFFRMPTALAVGTSLFQIIFVAAFTVLMHALQNQTVDILLAVPLILGGLLGGWVGARIGQRFNPAQLRAGLALVLLAIGLKLFFDLAVTPGELFSITQG